LQGIYPKLEAFTLLANACIVTVFFTLASVIACSMNLKKLDVFYFSNIASFLPMFAYAFLLMNFEPASHEIPVFIKLPVTILAAACISWNGSKGLPSGFYEYAEERNKTDDPLSPAKINILREEIAKAIRLEYALIAAPLFVFGFLPVLLR
jgi:hypothetical protein